MSSLLEYPKLSITGGRRFSCVATNEAAPRESLDFLNEPPTPPTSLGPFTVAVEYRCCLKERVLYWVSKNPGADSEDVARVFAITDVEASDIVQQLLREGLLEIRR